MKPRFLGIDVGTSACRACVIDADGVPLALASAPLPPPISAPEGGWEQDPACWWQALTQALAQLDLTGVRALAVDATSATVLITDANGQPLHPALLYHDSRAKAQAARLSKIAPADSMARAASGGLAKLMWLRESVPHAAKGMHQADWLAGRLLQRFDASDENNALKTGYDWLRRDWPDWLNEVIPPCFLPARVVAPGTPLGAMPAAQLGLPAGTQVIAGTTDSTAAFLASGATQPGDAVTTLGSTLVVKILAEHPINDPGHGVYSHRLGQLWLAGGASNSGGQVLRNFFTPGEIQRLTPQLRPDQPTGLDYYPLVTPGERFPIADPHYPPRLTPRPEDSLTFFQALLEGIAHIEAQGYAKLVELGAPKPKRVLTAGGGAVNEGWRQIRERWLATPVAQAIHTEAAIGAALLARQGFR